MGSSRRSPAWGEDNCRGVTNAFHEVILYDVTHAEMDLSEGGPAQNHDEQGLDVVQH